MYLLLLGQIVRRTHTHTHIEMENVMKLMFIKQTFDYLFLNTPDQRIYGSHRARRISGTMEILIFFSKRPSSINYLKKNKKLAEEINKDEEEEEE